MENMIADYIQTITSIAMLIITLFGLIIAGKQFYRQNRLSFYSKYTERYSQIMQKMPSSVLYNRDEFDSKKHAESIDSVAEFRKNIFLYFDLCSEEFYLWQTGYIEEDVWLDWQSGMKDFFNRASVKPMLQELVIVYKDAYPDFIAFLRNDLQIQNI